jgi:fructokinase
MTQDTETRFFGAIEAGGTKFLCAIGNHAGDIVDEARFETRMPETTLAEVRDYFETSRRKWGSLTALGIGAFGPLDLNPCSPTFGFITSTPKPGWQHTDLAGTLGRELRLPVVLDTDVNAAALGELRWGAGQTLDSVAYVTVGTGLGVGVVHHGRPVHGLMHPEIGHVSVRRHPSDSSFAGACPFHGDCLEGLAAGSALVARTGRPLSEAPPDDPIWAIEADYLGQLCALLLLCHSPQRILIGGGVMQARLYPDIQARMLYWLNGYVSALAIAGPNYITAPGLNTRSGIKGALSLALGAGLASVT